MFPESTEIIKDWQLVPGTYNEAQLRNLLAERINHLVRHDLNLLVSMLYRIDVDEGKLRKTLASYPSVDAGLIIADLVIERQYQKNKNRQQFKPRDDNPGDEERW